MSLGQIKSALEQLHTGTATVYGITYSTGEHGAEVAEEAPVFEDIPCRLSYDRKVSNDEDTYGRIIQDITMFCDPSYTIAPGSRIVITQNGVSREYRSASQAAVYESHQEIELTAFRRRA